MANEDSPKQKNGLTILAIVVTLVILGFAVLFYSGNLWEKRIPGQSSERQ